MQVPGIKSTVQLRHYRPWDQEMQLDLDVKGAGWLRRKVDRGSGLSTNQGTFMTCAAHGINNLAESWGLPTYDILELYRDSKALDDIRTLDIIQMGTTYAAMAEAWCRKHHAQTGKRVSWSRIPPVDEYVAKYIASTGCVAVGMRWYQTDFVPGFGNILERPIGKSPAAHALLFYGFDPSYTFSRYPFMRPFDFITGRKTNLAKTRTVRAFLAENSQTAFHHVRIEYGRLGGLSSGEIDANIVHRDGLEAIVFHLS